jgi:hypothetical protein
MLSEASLARALMQIAQGKDGMTSSAAEALWADAYDQYARQAQDVSSDLLMSSNSRGFRAALNFSGVTTAAGVSAQFEQAFLAYWSGATFGTLIPPPPVPPGCPNIGGNTIFASEVSSVVTLVTPGVMYANLLTEFSIVQKGESIEGRSAAIARSMHRATTTAVIVLITGIDTTTPPTGPLPITNLCQVH